jgi:glycosyltransferase involved in cell wall biosynthesis
MEEYFDNIIKSKPKNSNSVCLHSVHKLVAVIPFFNEENTLEKIIFDTAQFVDVIVAVNDGSTDNSFEKIKNLKNVICLNNPKNKGKGFALNLGFKKSIELNSLFTITLDADLQHSPEYIENLLTLVNQYDIIIGKRKKILGKMPIQRMISNFLTSFLLTLKTNQKIEDSQSGFRLYKTEILKIILPSSNGFESESEILINASKYNYKIGFVDIPTIYENEKSKMKIWKTIIGFVKVLFK